MSRIQVKSTLVFVEGKLIASASCENKGCDTIDVSNHYTLDSLTGYIDHVSDDFCEDEQMAINGQVFSRAASEQSNGLTRIIRLQNVIRGYYFK